MTRLSAANIAALRRAAHFRFIHGTLHEALGIKTHVQRVPILTNAGVGSFYERRTYDPVSDTWSSNHLYRANVTLAGKS